MKSVKEKQRRPHLSLGSLRMGAIDYFAPRVKSKVFEAGQQRLELAEDSGFASLSLRSIGDEYLLLGTLGFYPVQEIGDRMVKCPICNKAVGIWERLVGGPDCPSCQKKCHSDCTLPVLDLMAFEKGKFKTVQLCKKCVSKDTVS